MRLDCLSVVEIEFVFGKIYFVRNFLTQVSTCLLPTVECLNHFILLVNVFIFYINIFHVVSCNTLTSAIIIEPMCYYFNIQI